MFQDHSVHDTELSTLKRAGCPWKLGKSALTASVPCLRETELEDKFWSGRFCQCPHYFYEGKTFQRSLLCYSCWRHSHVFWCRTSTVCMFNLGTQILFLPERVTSVLYLGRNWRASLQLTLFLCLLLHDEETLDLWSWHHSLTLSPSPFALEMELHNTGTYICVPYENAMSPGLADSFVLSSSYSPQSVTSPLHGGEKTFGQAFKWTQQRSEEKNDVLTLLPPEWVPVLVKYWQASPGQMSSQRQTLPLGLQTRELCDLWASWS